MYMRVVPILSFKNLDIALCSIAFAEGEPDTAKLIVGDTSCSA
jgi:hypothetical protein